ncbi:hypothetical protein [Desulfomonile tiedjei]|nr:hypothetical protein [Desulfomonile tiedjei]
MRASATMRILGYAILVPYIALMVTNVALRCSCRMVGEQGEKRHVTHSCSHDSAKLSAGTHDRLGVLDHASISAHCCHCLTLLVQGPRPHIANPPEKMSAQSKSMTIGTLPNASLLTIGAAINSGDPPFLVHPRLQTTLLRTIILLI